VDSIKFNVTLGLIDTQSVQEVASSAAALYLFLVLHLHQGIVSFLF
jgi:hypothetical protein